MPKYTENADPMVEAAAQGGMLMDEGVAQLFTNQFNGRKALKRSVSSVRRNRVPVVDEYGAVRWDRSTSIKLAGSRATMWRNWRSSSKESTSTWH